MSQISQLNLTSNVVFYLQRSLLLLAPLPVSLLCCMKEAASVPVPCIKFGVTVPIVDVRKAINFEARNTVKKLTKRGLTV